MKNRVYLVSVNIDDISASNDTFSTDAERGEFLRGFLSGVRGAACRFADGSPGYLGHEIGTDSLNVVKDFQRKQSEKGKMSAAARILRNGTAKPEPRLNHGTNQTRTMVQDKSQVDQSTSNEPRLNHGSSHGSQLVQATVEPRYEPVSTKPLNQYNNILESKIEIDHDPKNEDNIFESEVLKSAKPIPSYFKPRVSILDWVASGHPRISLRNDDKALWQAFLDAWSGDPDWKLPWQEMYDSLVDNLKESNHKIFAQDAMTWMSAHYEPEVSNG